ncbi:nicotinamidase-related amidase [Bradyrhizobium japonicum]
MLVIDVQYRSVGDRPMPIRDAIKQYPTSCGEAGWHAIAHIAELVRLFREKERPVIFPHVARKVGQDQGAFSAKIPGIMRIPSEGYEFVREVAPEPGELLLPKTQASAFFGTPLATYLIGAGVDSLVVTGCTTSGCVAGFGCGCVRAELQINCAERCGLRPLAHVSRRQPVRYRQQIRGCHADAGRHRAASRAVG